MKLGFQYLSGLFLHDINKILRNLGNIKKRQLVRKKIG